MTRELYYVTGNTGKFGEVKEFIDQAHGDIDLKQIDIDLVEHQTLDQQAIAIEKAKQAWRVVQKPLLVDDAGVYFEAYHRFPGTLTKFVYQGIGFKGILKLIEDDHRAYYQIYLVYIDGPDSYQIFEDRCDGNIVEPKELKAHTSLPFDDIFVPNGTDKTYAELRQNHDEDWYPCRVRAVQKFLAWYKK